MSADPGWLTRGLQAAQREAYEQARTAYDAEYAKTLGDHEQKHAAGLVAVWREAALGIMGEEWRLTPRTQVDTYQAGPVPCACGQAVCVECCRARSSWR